MSLIFYGMDKMLSMFFFRVMLDKLAPLDLKEIRCIMQ